MAIQWGAWTSGYSNNFRVGIDLSVSGTKITARYYVEAQYVANDEMTLTRSGAITGSTTFRYNQSGGTKLVATNTRTGTRGSTYTFGAKLSGVYNGASPSVSNVKITVPVAPPSAPGKPSVSSITSNGAKVSWAAPATTNGASVSRYQIQFSQSSSFPSPASAYTTSRSYTSTSRAANTTYWVRVRAENSAGWSGWSPMTSFKTKVAKPNAPSNVSASRSSDTRIVVSWTRNATSGAPYSNIEVLRRSNVTGSYSKIATISGSATSYTDTSAVAGRRFRYQVRAKNDGGTSAAATSNYVSTTPPSPTNVQASRDVSDIDVTWSLPSNADGLVSHVEVWHAADGTWDGSPLATLSGLATSYTHASPDPSVTHTYRVRTRAALDSPTLTSAYSADSNTIQLLAPPNAPADLSPSGEAVDATEDVLLQWRHNPVDSTKQTRFQVRYREVGASEWTTLDEVTSAASELVIEAGTFDNGLVVEWQVRTWGQHATASPWSATATFTTSARPGVVIVTPEPDSTVASSHITVEWTYYDAEETEQAAYRIRLLDADDEVVWSASGVGDATSHEVPYTLDDDTAYRIEVEAADSDGLWSVPAEAAFEVMYARPPIPEIGGEWDLDAGAVNVTVTYPAVGDFEWTGNPDASASIEVVDEVETRRNLLPRPVPTGTGGWVRGSLSSDVTFAPGEGRNRRDAVLIVREPVAEPTADLGAVSLIGWAGPLPEDRPAVTGGETYTFSVYAKVERLTPWYALVGVTWIDAAGTYLDTSVSGEIEPLATDPDAWHRLTFTAEAPEDAATVALTVQVLSRDTDTEEGERVWLCDAQLEAGATASPFFYGDMPRPADPVSFSLVRSHDGGATWETVAADVPLDAGVVTDRLPRVGVENLYRVVTLSDLPSTAASDPVAVLAGPGRGHAWLNGGPEFAEVIRLRGNLSLSRSVQRARTLRNFAGRVRPVVFTGDARTNTLAVTGRIGPDTSTVDEVEAFGDLGGVAVYRDSQGRYLYVTVTDVNSSSRGVVTDVAVQMTEVDRT